VPAAAVIPAPVAYIKVAAVKKLVVRFLVLSSNHPSWVHLELRALSPVIVGFFTELSRIRLFTLRKLECFKQATALNTLAWNNKI
jgi:hypothetical protein